MTMILSPLFATLLFRFLLSLCFRSFSFSYFLFFFFYDEHSGYKKDRASRLSSCSGSSFFFFFLLLFFIIRTARDPAGTIGTRRSARISTKNKRERDTVCRTRVNYEVTRSLWKTAVLLFQKINGKQSGRVRSSDMLYRCFPLRPFAGNQPSLTRIRPKLCKLYYRSKLPQLRLYFAIDSLLMVRPPKTMEIYIGKIY